MVLSAAIVPALSDISMKFPAFFGPCAAKGRRSTRN